MKRINRSELFVSICFLAFLFGAMVLTVVREKGEYSFYENRSLAPVPEYTAEGDGDGSYVNQWEKYLSDHAALRNTLLKGKTRADLLLRRPVVNDVVIGDGILLPYLPPERVVFFGDCVGVYFSKELLGNEEGYEFTVEYSELADVLESWAIPEGAL